MSNKPCPEPFKKKNKFEVTLANSTHIIVYHHISKDLKKCALWLISYKYTPEDISDLFLIFLKKHYHVKAEWSHLWICRWCASSAVTCGKTGQSHQQSHRPEAIKRWDSISSQECRAGTQRHRQAGGLKARPITTQWMQNHIKPQSGWRPEVE